MSTSADIRLRAPSSEPANPEFVRGLGLVSSTTLVMGSMIGSGVYIVAADIARSVDSPALLIMAWIVTGFLTIVGALSYGELAAMMPKAGGQYVYLRESLGPLWGFLYGWTLFLVIQTGTIAAVGVAFGKFLGHFMASGSAMTWIWHIGNFGGVDVGINTQNLAGIVIIVLLTAVNIFGLRTGAVVQNIFTIAKVLALLGLVLAGIFVGRNPQAVALNFTNFWRNASLGAQHAVKVGSSGVTAFVGTLTILAVAQVGSLFSADAWNNVTFTAAEVKNPRRNLPLSLALGTGIVIVLYIAANLIYLNVLPLDGDPNGATVLARGIKYATQDRVGTAAMLQMFGPLGASLMAIAILISTFGCNNGLILAGARVYYAMAKDGLFFKAAGNIHPKYKTPAFSLILQCIWTCVLCISGSYNQLLNYVIFAVLIFYILTIGGLFILRFKQPNAERPYKAFGYPVLPAIYIAMAIFIDVVLLRYEPQFTWPGLIIVLLGIPVYLIWSRKSHVAPA
ncbi:MAG TPA: amino acid permease [Candidatus Angelobacter sp.]|nr:amino acid permease [Candidatus Angelobacter sp.]